MKGRRRAQEARNMRKHEMKPHKTRRRRKFPHQAKVDTSTTHTFTIERRQTRAPKEQEESNQLDRQTRAAHKDGNTKQRQTQRDKRERETERAERAYSWSPRTPLSSPGSESENTHTHTHTHTQTHTHTHAITHTHTPAQRDIDKNMTSGPD